MQIIITSKTLIPKQLTFSIIYFSSIFFLIVGFILWITFMAGIKKNTDQDGNVIYNIPSKNLLIISLGFSIVSLILLITNTIWYFTIFRFEKSVILYSFIGLGILEILLIGLNLLYLTKSYNFCPKNQTFSNKLNKCIDVCPSGSFYDDTQQKCVPGCTDEYPCDQGILCVGGQCCKNSTDINCGNECCSPSDCRNGICCSTPLCNGKCCGDIGICVDDHCEVKCGSKTCPPDKKVCMQIDVGTDQYKDFAKQYPDSEVIDGTAYACVNITDDCQPTENPQIFPYSITLKDGTTFYPVMENSSKDIIEESQTQFKNIKWREDLENTDANKGHVGGYCGDGFTNPTRFIQYQLNNPNCSYQKCVDLAFPNITTNVSMETNDAKDEVYCNYVLNYGSTFEGKPLSSYNLTYYNDDHKIIQNEERQFRPPPDKTNLRNTTTPKTFIKDCSAFKECPVKDTTYSCNPSEPTQNVANWINGGSNQKCQMMSKPIKPINTRWKVSSDGPLQYQDKFTLQAVKDPSDTSFNDQFISHLTFISSPCMKESSEDAATFMIIPADTSKNGNVMTGDIFYLQCKNNGDFKDKYLSTSCGDLNTPCWSNNQDIDEMWSFYDLSFFKNKSISMNEPVFLQKSSTKEFDKVPFYNFAVGTNGDAKQQPSMEDNTLYLNYFCSSVTYNQRNICTGDCFLPVPDLSEDPVLCSSNSAETKPLYIRKFVKTDEGAKTYGCIVGCCDVKETQQRITDYNIKNTDQENAFVGLYGGCSNFQKISKDCDPVSKNSKIWDFS